MWLVFSLLLYGSTFIGFSQAAEEPKMAYSCAVRTSASNPRSGAAGDDRQMVIDLVDREIYEVTWGRDKLGKFVRDRQAWLDNETANKIPVGVDQCSVSDSSTNWTESEIITDLAYHCRNIQAKGASADKTTGTGDAQSNAASGAWGVARVYLIKGPRGEETVRGSLNSTIRNVKGEETYTLIQFDGCKRMDKRLALGISPEQAPNLVADDTPTVPHETNHD